MVKKFKYSDILESLKKNKNFDSTLDYLKTDEKYFNIKTISGSLLSLYISLIYRNYAKNIFFICKDNESAENVLHDLKSIDEEINISFLAQGTRPKYLAETGIDDNAGDVLDGLTKLNQFDKCIAIGLPEIIKKELPIPGKISDNLIKLKVGELINFEQFRNSLLLNGFDRQLFVSDHGEISIRGSIIDVFPYGWDNPIRIEFFGNEIESLREFDPLSQRSIKSYKDIEFIGFTLEQENEEVGDIFSYIDKDALFIIYDYDSIMTENENFAIPDIFKKIYINKLGKSNAEIVSEKQVSFKSMIKIFAQELSKYVFDGIELILSAEGKIHIDRFRDLVTNALISDDEEDIEDLNIADRKLTLNAIKWIDSSLSAGFISKTCNLAVFTEHQVFERQRLKDSNQVKKSASAFTLNELKQLRRGDYVVHEDKGIAQFDGFENTIIGGNYQDCAKLIFSGGDILYVHLNYIHKIQKYSAQEGTMPKLSKLGSADWQRKKDRTKKRLKDIARDLILLYAKRKMLHGFAYPPDTMWQKEFEASFIYEDTPDQAKTTIEVKADMESETPMDRLVCGDVGFGKTEIAVRAAFKAVQAGKQVAILVPTTVLAQQHYMSFKDRLARYPVLVDSISRFKTKAQQKETVERVKQGKVDILIGTHRLLSKDVQFKDIGLLIIDEEHRFGVAAKEKIREYKHNIDTLTLTATPIPRTLNFSLMGARDLSVIETPPRNRLPVNTEIQIWNFAEIREAIEKEINRKGQVFFVNDKVSDLEKIKMDLEMLMPTFNFGIAHGQMPPAMIEKTMEKFIEKKLDVLMATKIIESGIDIPNANTMIINRAQNFGLAELYQLRGRVGRSNTQAYCYLIIPPSKELGTNGVRRLQAIEEFTDLGSGFQLAMRDMEIRGAGDLLGAEQSGFIVDIGFELFHKILDEAVLELKSEEFKDLFKDQQLSSRSALSNDDIGIELDTDAMITSDYISSDSERFMYYKKLYNIKTNEELRKLVEEITDKYGKPNKKASELFFAVRLRIASLFTGFNKIILKPHILYCEFPAASNKEYYENVFPQLGEYLGEFDNVRVAEIKSKLFLEVKIESRDQAVEMLFRIKKYLELIED